MKKNISGPVAIAIVVIVAILLLGGFYKKYVHEDSYTPQDLAAKMKSDGAKMHGGAQNVPNARH